MDSSGLLSFSLVVLFAYCNTLVIRKVPSENYYEVDAGDFREDIPQINAKSQRFLFQGDIAVVQERNALKDPTKRWTFPIPYILTDSLELNAKGVILLTFEQYRLKSCIDFKPYEAEKSFLAFKKLDGCWSYVGHHYGDQVVSVGERCDTKAIVEHELLHTLGFYHEQSRTDRDDYVNIWWNEIIPGMEHNFVVYDDDYITDQNTPYDYESVMHYAPFSFNKNDSLPTITAKIPAFDDIIGQRLDFSAIDLLRLNRMYNCTSTLTLLDQCAFEFINICGMIQGEHEGADWVHVKSSPGNEDHTTNGKCRDAGYFMYFDTKNGKKDQSAVLESRILYPKRAEQCLQFFYKMTGSPMDKLVIWMRMDDGTGMVRKLVKIETLHGDGTHSWNIAHVNFHATTKFRYVFQGIIGNSSNPSGGIFLDDVTFTETKCPYGVWHVKNFTTMLQHNYIKSIFSPCFQSPEGYRYGLILYLHSRYENYTGIFFHLCSGENDDMLEWPAGNRQAIVTVMDQDPDVKLRMSATQSFTTNGSFVISDGNDAFFWDRPTLTGFYDHSCDCYRSSSWGWPAFISHKQLHRRSFLKNDDLIIIVEFNDLTPLINTEVPIHPTSSPARHRRAVERTGYSEEHQPQGVLRDTCSPGYCLNGGLCVIVNGKASCRCASTQIHQHFGHRCERAQVHGTLLGVMIGATAGVLVLTIAIINMIVRKRN
ncbi:meprin A subunit alpha-like [Pristis pectinata]|uniref:meprin A subunit alpha-like n=1 Tax=Pristis pectinata TaxID=685728 RepID=UPI00223CCEDA|nr:meprin A subunit alpha-like [Pristis pectinata]